MLENALFSSDELELLGIKQLLPGLKDELYRLHERVRYLEIRAAAIEGNSIANDGPARPHPAVLAQEVATARAYIEDEREEDNPPVPAKRKYVVKKKRVGSGWPADPVERHKEWVRRMKKAQRNGKAPVSWANRKNKRAA